jgi:hypothetical protein
MSKGLKLASDDDAATITASALKLNSSKRQN